MDNPCKLFLNFNIFQAFILNLLKILDEKLSRRKNVNHKKEFYARDVKTAIKINDDDDDDFDAGSLSIRNGQGSDEGKYECVAENIHGTVHSYPASLYIRSECVMIS